MAGLAISFALLKTVSMPENFALPTKSPYGPYLVSGSALLMVIAPFAAVLMKWRLKEFLLAFTLSTGLLMGNLGFGLGLALFCAIIYVVAAKVVEVITFYLPQNTGPADLSDDDKPLN